MGTSDLTQRPMVTIPENVRKLLRQQLRLGRFDNLSMLPQ
jgi:hypothetical protein